MSRTQHQLVEEDSLPEKLFINHMFKHTEPCQTYNTTQKRELRLFQLLKMLKKLQWMTDYLCCTGQSSDVTLSRNNENFVLNSAISSNLCSLKIGPMQVCTPMFL